MSADDTALQQTEIPTGSTDEMAVQSADRAYLNQVRREIDAEVRRRRAAGDFPPSFERKLDELFARFTPVGTHDDRFSESLKLADRSAYFDIRVPIGARRRPRGFVKWALWSAEAWFVNYVVNQLNHFSSSVMRVLHLVDDRLDDLEQDVAALQPPVLDQEMLLPGPDLRPFLEMLVARLTNSQAPAGRVLHADCGDGLLLESLAAQGVDAYGVDPGSDAADRASVSGLDVRRDDVLGHLSAVGASTLKAVVLSGSVDRLNLLEHRRLMRLAEEAVAPGGVVAVVGITPSTWADAVGPVVADLSGARPLHAETWSYLLGEIGLQDISLHYGPVEGGFERLPASVGGADTLNDVLSRLEPLVARPASFAVMATRRR